MLTLKKVGLGYIKIGQQATTLSGGEAQRIKLAKELSKRSTGRTMYILDEPTTGLHQHDIKKLLEILHTFVSLGNTVVVIEHNLDVIKTADYIVDMGPEGGVKGGNIIAEGKPEEICNISESHTAKFLKEMLHKKIQKNSLIFNYSWYIINLIMVDILKSLQKTIHLSIALSLILFLGLFFGNGGFDFDMLFWSWLFRYFHVISGVMWIGLLWYFNFVQIPNMPNIPDEQKPAIGKVIAPAALFWFRWAAFSTIITGLIVAYLNGYVHQALMLGFGSGGGKSTAIGIGMWLGIIMAYNVWFIIWPNQKESFRYC